MKVPKEIMEKLFAQGRQEAPNEACGYLAGADGTAVKAIALTNVDHSPEHFSLDPKEQFAAARQLRAEGLGILAVYHTHPLTPARPSAEDIRLACDPAIIYVIASLVPGQEEAKAFRIRHGVVTPEELVVEEAGHQAVKVESLGETSGWRSERGTDKNMERGTIEALQTEIRDYSASQLLVWALDRFTHAEMAFATSFGAEDQVITDMLVRIDSSARVFTLDTGMLPPETLDVLRRTEDRYDIAIEVVRPEPAALERMLQEHGQELYYESVEKRKLCCHVRKVEPLAKTLAGLQAWVCGLRREQSVTRRSIRKIEWDEAFGLYKVNPLADWTEQQVWDYIRKNGVPYNALHDRGYPSIGCAPCTRAVPPGQDIRAGRWWWENPEHKECGLHVRDGKGAGRRGS